MQWTSVIPCGREDPQDPSDLASIMGLEGCYVTDWDSKDILMFLSARSKLSSVGLRDRFGEKGLCPNHSHVQGTEKQSVLRQRKHLYCSDYNYNHHLAKTVALSCVQVR